METRMTQLEYAQEELAAALSCEGGARAAFLELKEELNTARELMQYARHTAEALSVLHKSLGDFAPDGPAIALAQTAISHARASERLSTRVYERARAGYGVAEMAFNAAKSRVIRAELLVSNLSQ